METESVNFKKIYKGVPPFMEYTDGFGYYGVLLEEESSGKLQCHLCGITALNLSKHLFHKHKGVSSNDYRIKTGLNLTTPLMSESTRKLIKNNFLNLTEKKRKEITERLKKLNKRLHSNPKKQRENKASIQTNNKYGTCPEQVKSQFYEIYKKLDRIPNFSELSYRLKYIIETRFGSYEEAVVVWGIPRQEYHAHISESKNKAKQIRAENDFYPKYSKEEVKEKYLNFFKLKNRLPTWGEVVQFGLPGRVPFQRTFLCSKSELENSLKRN